MLSPTAHLELRPFWETGTLVGRTFLRQTRGRDQRPILKTINQANDQQPGGVWNQVWMPPEIRGKIVMLLE
jgi:hypothetical protein